MTPLHTAMLDVLTRFGTDCRNERAVILTLINAGFLAREITPLLDELIVPDEQRRAA